MIKNDYLPVLLAFCEGELTSRARSMGVRVYVLETRFRMRYPFRFFQALSEINNIINEVRPDLVHSTMPYSHLIVGLIRRFFGLKIREVWFQHGPVGGSLDRIASIFWTDCLFVNSHYTKEGHLETSWKRFGSIELIPLAVTEEGFESMPRKGALKNIGFAGRICPWKGVHLLVEAVDELSRSDIDLYTQLQFHICGRAMTAKDQAYEVELKENVQRLGLQDKITFHGFRADMQQFYREMDLLIHSSTIPEPFGLVVGEAMASNLLVLSSARGGVRELISEGLTAFCFDGSSVDLAQKIGEICTLNESKLAKIRENARTKVQESYSLKAMTDKIEACYQSLF